MTLPIIPHNHSKLDSLLKTLQSQADFPLALPDISNALNQINIEISEISSRAIVDLDFGGSSVTISSCNPSTEVSICATAECVLINNIWSMTSLATYPQQDPSTHAKVTTTFPREVEVERWRQVLSDCIEHALLLASSENLQKSFSQSIQYGNAVWAVACAAAGIRFGQLSVHLAIVALRQAERHDDKFKGQLTFLQSHVVKLMMDEKYKLCNALDMANTDEYLLELFLGGYSQNIYADYQAIPDELFETPDVVL